MFRFERPTPNIQARPQDPAVAVERTAISHQHSMDLVEVGREMREVFQMRARGGERTIEFVVAETEARRRKNDERMRKKDR